MLDRLASWCFIVIANSDNSSGDGYSSSRLLDFMLTQNGDTVTRERVLSDAGILFADIIGRTK